jgi:hypothetical protein
VYRSGKVQTNGTWFIARYVSFGSAVLLLISTHLLFVLLQRWTTPRPTSAFMMMFINHYSAKSLCARGAMLNPYNYSIQYFEELNARCVNACLELQMPPRRSTQ